MTKLSEQIVDDYWQHIDYQTEGMIMDWFVAYWRLAVMILPNDYLTYIQNLKSMTPERLQQIIAETQPRDQASED